MSKVCIIDYGLGNLRSVANACTAVGVTPIIAKNPTELTDAEYIILPGVGAFADGIRNLREYSWIPKLEHEVLKKKKPFLGICLGMQLLASVGTEHEENSGLDWISGRVERISSDGVRIPHVGWNDVRFNKQNWLYKGLGNHETFYFVHSYAFIPDDPKVVSGWCTYGTEFVVSIEHENICATQFHPEKSHKKGLAVLNNFFKGKIIC